MPKQPITKTPRRTAEAAERDYYRDLPGASGEIQRMVWGQDEAEFEYVLERELANAPPRDHIIERKMRRRWST